MRLFWSILFFGGLAWYVFTIFHVGIKGFEDVKQMLTNITKNNKAKEEKRLFWSILFFGGLAWYVFTIFHVGIKGFEDVKQMLTNITKNNKAKEENK